MVQEDGGRGVKQGKKASDDKKSKKKGGGGRQNGRGGAKQKACGRKDKKDGSVDGTSDGMGSSVVKDTMWTRAPLFMIDTLGDTGAGELVDDDGSKSNPGEAQLAVDRVQGLLDAGLLPKDIAIVTPYNAQAKLLRAVCDEYGIPVDPEFASGAGGVVEIGSVDGFQGREKEAIIMTTVRSNDDDEVGFLSDKRRMNVGITRARRHLTIIGNSGTLSSNSFLADIVDYIKVHGEYMLASHVYDE